MHAIESIPDTLRPAAQAAVLWVNASQNQSFELTGVVDYEQALTAAADEDYQLGLVLCDGELCAREQVHVQPTADGFEFELVEAAARDIPPLLDPPVGVRRHWLSDELKKHEFVLLLFYRGLW